MAASCSPELARGIINREGDECQVTARKILIHGRQPGRGGGYIVKRHVLMYYNRRYEHYLSAHPQPGPGEKIRRKSRRERRQFRGRSGRDLRISRTQRGGQNDDDQDDRGLAKAHLGRGARGGLRRSNRAAAGEELLRLRPRRA